MSRATEPGELKSYWKTVKPLTSDTNRTNRKRWCRAHQQWTGEQWRRVLWSGESPSALTLSKKTRVWRRSSERSKPWATTASVKHGERVSVWGCFAAHGVGNLYLAEGTLKKDKYRDTLTSQAVPLAERLLSMEIWHSQQGSDPKHTARTTKAWLRRSSTPLLPWPSLSPGLSPTENLWSYLDYSLRARRPGSSYLARFARSSSPCRERYGQ